jgi:phosphosulfolactate synthase (CoM biosynthesis protein A)
LKNKIRSAFYSDEIGFNIAEKENGTAMYEASENCRYVELVYIMYSGIKDGEWDFCV